MTFSLFLILSAGFLLNVPRLARCFPVYYCDLAIFYPSEDFHIEGNILIDDTWLCIPSVLSILAHAGLYSDIIRLSSYPDDPHPFWSQFSGIEYADEKEEKNDSQGSPRN